jgi:hypothetical protein
MGTNTARCYNTCNDAPVRLSKRANKPHVSTNLSDMLKLKGAFAWPSPRIYDVRHPIYPANRQRRGADWK